MKKLIIFLFLFFAVFSLQAQDLGVIKVVSEEWEDATNADGSGLYFDIIRAVFEKHGGIINIQIYPYERSVSVVENKKADIVIGLYEDETDKVLYPEYHIDNDNVCIMYLKTRLPDFSGESSLSGLNLIWMRGYAYDEYFEIPLSFTEADRRDLAIQMVLNGRSDGFLDAYYDITAELENMGIENSDLVIEPVKYLHLYLGFADNARGRQLAGIWDSEFEKLMDSGLLNEMFREWEFEDYIR